MCVRRKPQPLGNEIHNICCGLTSILWRSWTVEDKDGPQQLGRKECNELGNKISLMFRIFRPIFGSRKAVVLDSGFYFCKMYYRTRGQSCLCGSYDQ